MADQQDPPGRQGPGPEDPTPPQGSMRFQDETTQPREPTLAERKAREQAERRQQAEAEAQEATAAAARRKRKRILIGGGVTVGVVAVIAVGYAIATANDDVRARCVGDDGVVADDANCVTPAASSTHYTSGGGFYPIFIGTGGRQYHYVYGGSGTIGQPISGGTTTVPRGSTRVTTPSGRTVTTGRTSGTTAGSSGSSSGSSSDGGGSGTVSRGGLGSSSSGSSSGT